MEKRGALINRLQQQYSEGKDESVLLHTTLLLLAELQGSQTPEADTGKVSVIMPYKPFEVPAGVSKPEEDPQVENQQEVAPPEKSSETAPEPSRAEPEDEVVQAETVPEETLAEEMPVHETALPPAVNSLVEEKYEDVIETIPTLAQQQPKTTFELNDAMQTGEPSINDRLKQQTREVASKVKTEPIKDLKKAIGINDKYRFVRELFRNDETAYERSLKTINSFNVLQEAEYWIQREMKYKLGWDDNNATVQDFYQLVRRRFS